MRYFKLFAKRFLVAFGVGMVLLCVGAFIGISVVDGRNIVDMFGLLFCAALISLFFKDDRIAYGAFGMLILGVVLR